MISPAASQAQVEEMAGVLHSFLDAPGGLVSQLSPRMAALVRDTQIQVVAQPDAAMLRSVGAAPDDHLLGIFTTPHPLIRIFANENIALGTDPTTTVEHELGHRLHFDHDLRPARIPVLATAAGALCLGPHDAAGQPMGAAALDVAEFLDPTGDAGYCPVCHAHDDTADAVMLLEGLTEDTFLAAQPHEIPLGLGGTIPLARRRLACAQFDLLRALNEGNPPPLADRPGEVRDASRLLHEAGHALAGWLDPQAVSAARAPLRRAWRAVYTLNHAYFLTRNHAGDPALRASDLELIAAFQPH